MLTANEEINMMNHPKNLVTVRMKANLLGSVVRRKDQCAAMS